MSVTLIRSAYDPDPYPERGIHDIRIGVCVSKPEQVKDVAAAFCRPLAFLSATKHGGKLALDGSFMTVKGNVRVSVIKNSEDKNGVAVRVYDTTGKTETAKLSFCKPVKAAYIAKSTGKKLCDLVPNGDAVSLEVPAYSAVTAVITI